MTYNFMIIAFYFTEFLLYRVHVPNSISEGITLKYTLTVYLKQYILRHDLKVYLKEERKKLLTILTSSTFWSSIILTWLSPILENVSWLFLKKIQAIFSVIGIWTTKECSESNSIFDIKGKNYTPENYGQLAHFLWLEDCWK